ncbi:MAG: UDP-N-acetylmuramate--L-alanine ligase, partial [Synergistaceae bacterium]|nr:UDP-N-acetylmuramate--L-alanine ligase [Synergistaceae bacterium]
SPQIAAYSSAVDANHEELLAARASGARAVGRGRLLSWLFKSRQGVGIAGTHGKTTTASMIGIILERAGWDPTLAVGAEIRNIGTNARLGSSGLFVAEIDESDGSFEFFSPAVTVITNIDWDHVDHFPAPGDVLAAFVRFARARKPETPLILCAEDEGTQSLRRELRGDANVLTYGWGAGSWDWGAFDVTRKAGGGVVFSVAREKKTLGRVELTVSGEHNVLNALAACVAASSLGVPFGETAEALREFRGARRRLEKMGEKKLKTGGAVDVIGDYAHHPREISATLSALRDIYPERRLVVVFQPHRYTRTGVFYREIASALGGADAVLLLPIYAAGEEPSGVTSASIADAMSSEGHFYGPAPVLCGGEEDARSHLEALLREGDVLALLGAGDIVRLGEACVTP